MYHECRHIMPSGARCKSPALRESAFCYYHVNLRRTITPKTKVDHMFVQLPSLEDTRGLQIALMEVLTALASTRIDAKRAGLLLYGLQIAAQINKRAADTDQQPVRSVEYDSEGNDLAPVKSRCEPPNDCPTCPLRDDCDKWEEFKEKFFDNECKPTAENCESCPLRGECSDSDDDESENKDTDGMKSFSGLLPELTGCAEEPDAQPTQPLSFRATKKVDGLKRPRSFRATGATRDESKNLHLPSPAPPQNAIVILSDPERSEGESKDLRLFFAGTTKHVGAPFMTPPYRIMSGIPQNPHKTSGHSERWDSDPCPQRL